MRFVHQTLPQRVVFAAGDSPAAVASEIEALGRSKVLLIASGREEAQAAPIMAKIPVVLRHDEVVMHVPVAVAARAREAAACGADIVVTVGGGSATGRVLAQEGIAGLAAGLPLVKAAPSSLEGIEQTLYGAYLAAVSFAGAGSGMHHKICHVLGGMFNLPHAETHAVVLPHVLAYNAPSAPEAERRIAQGFGSATAREGLRDLRARLGAPRALRDYGLPADGIAKAVGPIMSAIPASNPRAVSEDSLTALLQAAWAGEEPN